MVFEETLNIQSKHSVLDPIYATNTSKDLGANGCSTLNVISYSTATSSPYQNQKINFHCTNKECQVIPSRGT